MGTMSNQNTVCCTVGRQKKLLLFLGAHSYFLESYFGGVHLSPRDSSLRGIMGLSNGGFASGTPLPSLCGGLCVMMGRPCPEVSAEAPSGAFCASPLIRRFQLSQII